VVKTLRKDREIEWGFLEQHLEPATEFITSALDFGPMPPSAPTSQLAIGLGYRVTAVGLENITLLYPRFVYIQRDINEIEQPGRFDVVINISTTEHVGSGRYGDPIGPDLDMEAMRRMRSWMRPFARMYMTIPVGLDAIIGNYHRVYGKIRLPHLLKGYMVLKEQYWNKTEEHDEWALCSREEALAEEATPLPVESLLHLYYAIGGFVLGVN